MKRIKLEHSTLKPDTLRVITKDWIEQIVATHGGSEVSWWEIVESDRYGRPHFHVKLMFNPSFVYLSNVVCRVQEQLESLKQTHTTFTVSAVRLVHP